MFKINGILENEAIVFKVDKDIDGTNILKIKTDDKKDSVIFEKYYELLV